MHPLLLTSLDDGLRFGSPGWLWALLLLAPLLWFFVDAARRRESLLARIVAPRLHDRPLLAMAQRAETALAS